MTRRLLITYVALAAVVTALLGIPLGVVLADLERERLVAGLERDAVVVANLVEEALEAGAERVDPGINDYLAETEVRIVITDDRGIAVYDPDNPDVRRDYSTREEIEDALEGQRVVGERYSQTLGTGLLYVAVPISSERIVHGTVRLTHTTAEVDAFVRSAWGLLGGLALLTLGVAALAGVWIARWVARPTAKLAEAVSAFTDGDASARAPVDDGPPEVRDLAARFNRMAARLSELLDSQQQFVATASHQLRSPLQAMRLELETATTGGRVDPAAVARATEETRRLGRVVDGLLAIARADAAPGTVVDVDVVALLRDRAEVWGALADEQGIEVVVDAPDRPLTAKAVEGHAEQVMDNLIANALDAQPDGGRLVLRTERVDGRAAVRVDDAGPGLPDGDLERVFERFWRGSRTDGGSGLGLPIARQLARASGGDLWLEHAPGGGLRAVLELPTTG